MPMPIETRRTWIARRRRSPAGVSRATLYAYVSRGQVRSQAMPGPSRARALRPRRRRAAAAAHRKAARPDKAAARSLQWGLPVLESSIALIDGRRLFYRGHDAVTLARSRSVAEVASLIWTGGFDGRLAGTPHRAPDVLPDPGHALHRRARRRCWPSPPPATRRRSTSAPGVGGAHRVADSRL